MQEREIEMDTLMDPSLLVAIERIREATNQHDLDALVACFAPEYQSAFPAHPDRAFQGHAQLRKNWTQIFRTVPRPHGVASCCCGWQYGVGRMGMDRHTRVWWTVHAARCDHSRGGSGEDELGATLHGASARRRTWD